MDVHEEFVPEETFQTFLEHFPQVSVELLLERNGEVFLAKRLNEPAKGEWFWPGGRLQKGERLEEAVHRVASDELNISVEIQDLFGVYEHFWEAPDPSQHTVNIVYHVRPVDATATETLDEQHSDYQYVTEPNPSFHAYVNQYLRDFYR